MNNEKQMRKNTRTQVWPDTKATLKIEDPYSPVRRVLTISGQVGDLGSNGMFLVTEEKVPVPAKAEIIIDFDSSRSTSTLKLDVMGETVRSTDRGVGIKFTSIDMQRLQECILARMNKS